MQKSFVKGAILSLFIICSFALIQEFELISAADGKVIGSSISFEETSIIEFENESDAELKTFRMWLSNEVIFKSFKTEKGWTAKKTPEGVLVFTTTEPVEAGDSVKFGIKTDKAKPGVNWKALDKNENQIEIGKILVSESSTQSSKNTPSSTGGGVLKDSTFRIIPEKPNVGSTVRITGENFGVNQELSFYIDERRLEEFQSNDDGFFMFTSKIPNNIDAERIDFSIRDSSGESKSLSLRLGESQERMSSTDVVPLTIKGLPEEMTRGEVVSVTGTAVPGNSVTATIKDPTGEILTTNATKVDSNGKWSYETVVPLEAPLGTYSAEITDGTETIQKTWVVKSSKIIEISPLQVRFDAGEIMKFNGSARPNERLELSLENPQGVEVISDVLDVGSNGLVQFEHETDFSYLEGTYILFASQLDETEIILVGLGELPEEQLVAQLGELNYKAGETATIVFNGPASSNLSLLIVDPADKNKFTDTITLDPDGKKAYDLDLTGYASGVYTVVITRGNAQTSEVFSVGLQTGSGPIEIRTTKDTYSPGDSILILGNSGANILVTLTLLDPDGEEIKVKESFTNREGQLSESSFRVPTNAKTGTWSLNAKSGSNFDNTEFSVHTGVAEGLTVFVDNRETTFQGDLVTIKGFGSTASKTIKVIITAPSDEEITELTVFSTGSGEFSTIWLVPTDLIPGEYTITVNDDATEAETTIEID